MKDGQTYISEVLYGRQGNLYGFRVSSYAELNGMNNKINPFIFKLPYILESNPHPFYSFRGLKNRMRIRIAVVSWILKKW